jgi:hypothetical protein
LLVISEHQDMVCTQGIVGRHGKAYGGVDLRNLLDDSDVFVIAKTGPTQGLGNQYPHEAKPTGFFKHLYRKGLGFVPFHDMGFDILPGKFPGRLGHKALGL